MRSKNEVVILKMNKEGKTWLNEISIMRPVLLVLLVAYHAFAPYVGSWDKPDGIEELELYRWIGLLSRLFRLEGFVFISGYIFTFQVVERHKFDSLMQLLKSKAERLLIPCFFFSIIYLLAFKNYDSVSVFAQKVIQGAGHLWYLFCLFWCFVIHYLILKNDNPKVVVPVLIIALTFSIAPLPLNLNKPLYYMLFFYGGGLFLKNSQKIVAYATQKNIICSWLLFLVVFVMANAAINHISSHYNQLDKFLLRTCSLEAKTVLKAILGWSGIWALYLSASRFCQKHETSDWIIKLGACGYGVYVFHQFILVYLYQYTGLPAFGGTLWLPWMAFMITTAISLVMTMMLRKTQLGRKYL